MGATDNERPAWAAPDQAPPTATAATRTTTARSASTAATTDPGDTLRRDTEITAEQIVRLFPGTQRPHAERVLAYIELRRQGETSFGAVQRLGLDVETNPARYERWMTAVLDAFGQPQPPAPPAEFRLPNFAGKGMAGRHNRWHAGRGRTSPDCPLCRGEQR